MSNPANDWSGNTLISQTSTSSTGFSILQLGANEVIPDGFGKGAVIFNNLSTSSSAILDLDGFNETVNGITNAAGSTPAKAIIENPHFGTLSTLSVGAGDASSSTSRHPPNNGGTLALAKIGAGTLAFTGANANTYTGTTTVNAGVLSLATTSGTRPVSSNVIVNGGTLVTSTTQQLSGAALTLNGGAVQLNAGTNSVASVAVTAGTLQVGSILIDQGAMNLAGGAITGSFPAVYQWI